MRALIALLTDFGTRDPYVAQVKGVIAMRCDGEIVDLSHEIAPFDVTEGAFFLRDVVGSLLGTRRVFVVAVVDPGVGSPRKLLAAQDGNVTLIGPDNGLLSLALRESAVVREITNATLFLPGEVKTFHGRDRFAPVAAALASGTRFEEVGALVERGAIVAIDYSPPIYDDAGGAAGRVTAIDRYGNVATDLDPKLLGGVDGLVLKVGGMTVARSAASYAEMAGSGELFLIVGSRGTVELSVSGGSASARLGARLLQEIKASRVS